MAPLEQIQADVEALSQEEFVRLREKDWLLLDQQLAADVADGSLDCLLEETMAAQSQGQLQNL